LTLTDTGGTVLALMLGYRKFKKTKTGPNPIPDLTDTGGTVLTLMVGF